MKFLPKELKMPFNIPLLLIFTVTEQKLFLVLIRVRCGEVCTHPLKENHNVLSEQVQKYKYKI